MTLIKLGEENEKRLDILTKKGQESLKHEKDMISIVKSKYDVDVVETNKDKPALCDGFTVRNGIITGIYESKCRNATIKDFNQWGSWLITYDKIDGLAWMSSKLCVPAIGFLYLISEKIVLHWTITNNIGDYLFDFEVKKTSTQETINGGKIIRENAYLPIRYAKLL